MSQVLVCSASGSIHPKCEEDLKKLGVPSTFIESVEDLKSSVASDKTSIIVFEIDFLEMIEDDFLKELESQMKAPFVLLSGKDLEFNLLQLRRTVKIEHVIAKGQTTTVSSLAKVLKEIVQQQTGQRLTGEGIRDLIHTDSVKVVKTYLSNSNDRWDCYKELSKTVVSLPVFNGFDDIAATIASELITNAFYNGPRNEEDGGALHPSRKKPVALEKPKRVEFSYWSTETDFWLMVVDPFGSLKRSELVASLYRAVTERTAKLESDGGAGLGLRMIADWASELYFGLCDQESTWIACKLKITKRRRVFNEEVTSLHIYEVKGADIKGA